MNKVLYICHNNLSGWGRAARDNILALDKVGLDVVWRSIKLNIPDYEPSGRLLELLEKDIHDANYVVQHVLPQYLCYNSSYKKNISYFVAETLGWEKYSGWKNYLNLMDETWAPNTEMLENSLKIPTYLVPHPCNIEKYSKKYPKVEIPNLNSGYNFYFIGEWNKRKRIGALIQAFNLEFNKTEPVNLILKVNKSGVNPASLGKEVQKLCQEIKRATKLYSNDTLYPSELIISNFMNEEEINGLHQQCHCAVGAQYGGSWEYFLFDAMAFGNAVISSNCGGPKDYLNTYTTGFLTEGKYKSVFGMHQENFTNYNTSRENWYEADIDELRKQMRYCYSQNLGVKKNNQGLKIANKCSYERVGKRMMELLNV